MAVRGFRHHLGLKLISLALASLLWLVVSGEQVGERALRVPLEFTNLPAELELVGDAPDEVEVRVRASSGTVSRISAGDLVAVVDLQGARPGRRLFHVTADDVRRPTGVDVVQVNPSSLAPALIALNAKIKVFGPSGEREVAADKFFVTPKSDSDREYDLKPNEIVTWVTIPPALGVRSATYEVRQREALDWPLAAASVALTLDAGKKVKAARVAMGHVAPTPWLAAEAAEYLTGKTISEDVAAEAGRIAVAQAKPLGRNTYKVQLARVAVKRAILQAAG